MTLSQSIDRLLTEKRYAEYLLMCNPNDEKAKSLVEAIDVSKKFIDDFVCHIMHFSEFSSPCEKNTLPDADKFIPPELNADELPFG